MPFDSDVALLGTGVAPLIAASHLLAQGKSVLLLNPDRDFFLEDSELSLDPLMTSVSVAQLAQSMPEQAIAQLRPDFPGAVEFWPGQGHKTDAKGYHDAGAPHVRSRSRVWLTANENNEHWNWGALEGLYVEASDAGLKPQILEGLQAVKRFPGFPRDYRQASSAELDDFRGLLVPRLCDVDVTRYRNGILEFVRERLGDEHIVCSAGQIELMPGGIRFHSGGAARTARIREGTLVFWTPRMSPWVLSHAKQRELHPPRPKGVRLWEEWTIISREPLDHDIIGMFGDMTVWAEVEGSPSAGGEFRRMAVLRAGPLLNMDLMNFPEGGLSWASDRSFRQIARLCSGMLRWGKFSVRGMRPRAVFEWERRDAWLLAGGDSHVQIVPGSDGPLFEVARNVRIACAGLQS